MKSIRWKLVIMYIALVFIVMIISGTFVIFSLGEREKTNAFEELENYANYIEEEVVKPNYMQGEIETEETYQNVQDDLQRISKGENASTQGAIIRYSPYSKKTIASTAVNDSGMFMDYNTKVVIAAGGGTASFDSGRRLPDYGDVMRPFYEYAKPFQTGRDNITLIIYVRKDATQSNENLLQITNFYAMSVIVALVITAVLGVLFASTLTVPIANLTNRAKELAKGDLRRRAATPVAINTKDEIGQLSESFNHMAGELANIMSDIESEKSKMEILLNNMTDGVLAYDGHGNLLHANYVCNDLLGISDLTNMPFREVMNLLEIDARAEAKEPPVAVGMGEPPVAVDMGIEYLPGIFAAVKDSAVSINDKYINASFNLYKNKENPAGGIVIVLQDITKHMKLDNMRREFVANVSHELRTPLTTIKGYTETLMEGAVDDKTLANDFLQIIDNETDRMTSIVKDLLELSRFDNKQLDLNTAETDLVALVKKVVKQNIVIAEKQRKSIVFDPPGTEMPALIDEGRIIQVLNNIITNSLKYSNDNAYVKICLEETESYYRIYVQDNGLGIPKEDIRRIFERFYRVDKARSREMGGTGLGLSIAKEIMEAHGGKISCSSELGKGTTMILRFNKDFYALPADTDMLTDMPRAY